MNSAGDKSINLQKIIIRRILQAFHFVHPFILNWKKLFQPFSLFVFVI